MVVLAKKTQKKMLLMIEWIKGIILMAVGFIILPVAVFSIDASLLTNLFVWGFVIVEMAFFGLVGVFAYIRPLLLYKKLPDVQAETDGTYLYLYGKKEVKIPLAEMREAEVEYHLPYMMSSEFIIHLFSEHYGKVMIKVPHHGKYKLHYVANARQVPDQIREAVERRTV